MGTVGLVLGVVYGGQHLCLTLGVVGDDHLDRVEYGRDAQGACVQVVAQGTLEEGHVVQGVNLRVANLLHEVLDAFGRVAATAETADGRHSRVVPSAHQSLADQHAQVALRQQDVVQVQFVELRLARAVVLDVVRLAAPLLHPGHEEVVQGTVLHELQRTPRVGDPLQVVALAVGEVIHGVGVPLRARLHVRHVEHTVDQRVAEQHVRVGHVNLGAQGECARFALAAVHILKQLEALLDGTVAEGRVSAGRGRRALLTGYLLAALLVHVGATLLDEPHGEVPQLLEVV